MDGLLENFIKDNIKVFGYYYGNNANDKSFEENLKKMSDGIKKYTRKNLFDKAFIINTYILSQIQYIIKLYPINDYYNKKINLLIFRFLWNSTWEKLPRKIIHKGILNGGLSISNIKLEVKQILSNFRQNKK